MKVFASFCVAGAALLLARPVLADDVARGAQVQVVTDGSIVATTSLPADAVLRIDADGSRIARTIRQDEIENITTATGHAVLVATRGGREFVTLRGDQLVVTQMQPYTGKRERTAKPDE